MEEVIYKNFYEIIKNRDEIKLETFGGYYYKGIVKEIKKDFILIRDVRGTLWKINLEDIYFIKILPKGYKKPKIFDNESYKKNFNSNVIMEHNEEKIKNN